MKKCRRYIKEIDVTERYAVLYGAGEGILSLNPMLFYNTRYIVDADKSKHGRKWKFYNYDCKVQSPDILKKLNPNAYYIVICVYNDAYIEEILKQIYFITGNKDILYTIRDSDFRYTFPTIEDLFLCDPILHKKYQYSFASVEIRKAIDTFYNMVHSKLGNECLVWFESIKNCFGIIVKFGTANKSYIYKLPKIFMIQLGDNVEESCIYNERFRLRQELRLDDEITICEESDGYIIEKCCDIKSDINRQDISRLLRQLRSLHCSTKKVSITYDVQFWSERLYLDATKNYRIWNDKLALVKQILDSVFKAYYHLPAHRNCLCHCDIHRGNIVWTSEGARLIDWESMAMTDPMLDICELLLTCFEQPSRIEIIKLLHDYYEAEPSNKQISRCLLMLPIALYLRILRTLISPAGFSDLDSMTIKRIEYLVNDALKGI